jgi:murein DD-endopeptidase MepM/ murein hydrolase activator NlpD
MVLRGIFTAVGIGATVVIGSVSYIGTADSKGYGLEDRNVSSKTLGLAPLSLGNPSAAHPGLLMTVPDIPVDDVTMNGPKPIYQTLRAGRGDTLAALLSRAGASNKEAHAAISALKKHFNPRKFRQGQEVRVAYLPDGPDMVTKAARIGAFQGFSLKPNLTTEVNVLRDEKGDFTSFVSERPLTTELARAEGVIGSSLYVAGKKAGLPNSALAELIRAYSWDVDFQRDIRKGDGFQVMYERVIDEDGNLVKSDKIIFATLTLSGKAVSAYRFKSSNGHVNYYNEKGLSARKALMRTPIDGARLSSGFGRRKHPILGYTKRHTGVDFAAPRGTPIYAAGNGTISYAGNKGGYGRYISIRHNGTYTTAYAHMKGFARGMGTGKRVNQGQVIGYVGTTGRSTGPHLHYEIIRNGRKTNPLRVKMPAGTKLKGSDLKRFLKVRKRVDQQFASIETGSTLVASTK